MEPMFDSEGRSPIQTSVTTAVVAVPGDVLEKIREIVSILSRALVLSLSLLKATVSTREISGDNRTNNRSEHMVLEEGKLDSGGEMGSYADPVQAEGRLHYLLSPAPEPRVWGSTDNRCDFDCNAFIGKAYVILTVRSH